MKSRLVRWVLVLLAVIVIVAGNIMWAMITQPSKGYAEIRNQSGETISAIDIKVCESRFSFRDLPGNTRVGFSFPINCDSSYEIDALLLSGKRLQARAGYVTHGLDSADALTIKENEIRLSGVEADQFPVRITR